MGAFALYLDSYPNTLSYACLLGDAVVNAREALEQADTAERYIFNDDADVSVAKAF